MTAVCLSGECGVSTHAGSPHISAHLGTSRRISAHLGASRRISAYLSTSRRHLGTAILGGLIRLWGATTGRRLAAHKQRVRADGMGGLPTFTACSCGRQAHQQRIELTVLATPAARLVRCMAAEAESRLCVRVLFRRAFSSLLLCSSLPPRHRMHQQPDQTDMFTCSHAHTLARGTTARRRGGAGPRLEA